MKVCVVTGGSRGIGECVAQAFCERGYTVVAMDILPCNLQNVRYIPCDISNPEEIKRAFETIKSEYKCAHVLINNAAIASFEKNISQVSVQEYDAILNTNLRGSYLCSKEFILLNSGQEYGRIINIASTRWHQNEENWELYGMSKGGIVSLTNSLCVSLRGTPITVNAISPGFIHTGDVKELSAHDHEIHPSNRVGRPTDISNACVFLADAQNDFINGANLIVDGGMTKRMIY